MRCLRHVGAGVGLSVVVGSWPWVHVTVRNGHVSAHICADPVGDVFLVHGVLVCVVLSWAWEIDTLVFYIGLYAEAKFRHFPSFVEHVAGGKGLILEVEVTKQRVGGGRWSKLICTCFFLAHRLAEADALGHLRRA